MLTVTIPDNELWDDLKGEFIQVKRQTLQLEHSLVSLHKWESRWHKPFISEAKKTYEETVDYIKCMTITQNVDQNVYEYMPKTVFDDVDKYINESMSATTFTEDVNALKNRDVVTAEIIYYWMVSYQIPYECRKWHLNQLMSLIRVCNIKNAPQKKMSMKEIMSRNKKLNDERKKKFNSHG